MTLHADEIAALDKEVLTFRQTEVDAAVREGLENAHPVVRINAAHGVIQRSLYDHILTAWRQAPP